MALSAPVSSTTGRDLVPPGKYGAIVCGIYDIGTQTSQFGANHQIVISFELHQKGLDRPLVMSKFYNLSMNIKSSLRPVVEGILGHPTKDGTEFDDFASLVGVACVMKLGHKTNQAGKPQEQILMLDRIDDGDPKPAPQLDQCYFEITKPGCPIPQEVPDWIQAKIKASPEWLGEAATGQTFAPADDDIPF